MIALVVLCLALDLHAEPGWEAGVRHAFQTLWRDFERGDTAALDSGLMAETGGMYRACVALDLRDGGERGSNFLGLVQRIRLHRGLDRLAAYYYFADQDPVHDIYGHYIQLHAAVHDHRFARTLVRHELTHGFDRLTGFWRDSLPGVSITAAIELRARRGEVALLRDHVPRRVLRRWWDEELAKRSPGHLDMNVRFMTRLHAAESGDLGPVFAELMDEEYQRAIRCELRLDATSRSRLAKATHGGRSDAPRVDSLQYLDSYPL